MTIKFTELNKTFIIKKKIKSHRNSRGRVKRQPARKRNEISASLDLSLSLFLAHLRCEPAAHEIPKPPPTFQNSQTPPFLVALPPPFSSAPDSLCFHLHPLLSSPPPPPRRPYATALTDADDLQAPLSMTMMTPPPLEVSNRLSARARER